MTAGSVGGTEENGGAGASGADGCTPGDGAMRDVVLESNARLRYWIYGIYGMHGLQPPALYRSPHTPATHDYEPWSLRLALSTRCLVLELSSFQAIHGHYTRIKSGLPVRKKGGLDMIIKGHRVHGELKRLRDGIAHSGITLGELAHEVNQVGLCSYVHYARAALMFEDAVYMTILRKGHKTKMDERMPAFPSFCLPKATDRKAFVEKYARVDFALDAECHRRDCAIMQELVHSLHMLYRGFCIAARDVNADPPYGRRRFNDHLYNIKYMILDAHCFIKKFRKLEMEEIEEPAFASREGTYEELRHEYAAHTKIKRVRGIEDVLEGHPRLLDDILLDIVEIGVFASRLLDRFESPPAEKIVPMSPKEAERMDREMWRVQVESHKCYGFDYVGFYGGSSGPEAQERARRDLG